MIAQGSHEVSASEGVEDSVQLISWGNIGLLSLVLRGEVDNSVFEIAFCSPFFCDLLILLYV